MSLLAGCTAPNPLDCADGTCSDPAHPFCDVDGTLGGQPMACIAVTCAPGAFQACRGDQVLTCNTVGNDYDIAQCEHGCDEASQGCVACLSNAECANPAPTCDLTSHSCRACQVDGDCDSEMCDASGACVDPAKIIYAATDGSAAGDCGAQAMPCSFERAFTLIAPDRSNVRLRAGTYTSQTSFPLTIPAGQTDYVDATGVTINTTIADAVFIISGPGQLHLKGATFVEVIGGTSHSSNTAVQCGVFGADTATQLLVERITFLGGDDVISVNNCDAILRQSRVQTNSYKNMFLVSRHSTLTLDRCWLQGGPTYAIPPIYTNDVTDPIGVRVHITNSVFVNTGDMFIPQGVLDVDHSTFINPKQPVDCTVDTSGNDHGKRIYSNSLFISTFGLGQIWKGGACEFHYSLMYPQASDVPNSDHMLLQVDPRLVDIANGDYHLSAVSPAIDAADPASMLPIDYDGNPRPEGPRTDIGAFELAP